MTYGDHLIREVSTGANRGGQSWSAEILEGVAAIGQNLFVRIPGIDPQGRRGPCPWTPQAAKSGSVWLPGGGEDALVVFDDDKVPWVAIWIPGSKSHLA